MTAKLQPSHTAYILIRSGLFALLTVILLGLAWGTTRGAGEPAAGVAYGPPDPLPPSTVVRGLGRERRPDTPGRRRRASHRAVHDRRRTRRCAPRRTELGAPTVPLAQIESERGHFDWARWDHAIAACERHNVPVVAVLLTSPAWARSDEDLDNPDSPPASLSDFGDFAAALATRYGPSLSVYQIWDAPNVQPNWGNGLVSPAEYMRLLREGSLRMRAVNPNATIVLAGLAPTTEVGPLNLSESLFLDALYHAGASAYFDVVAAKPYGFWSGPDDRVSTAPCSISRGWR